MNRRRVLKLATALGCGLTTNGLFALDKRRNAKKFVFINLKGGPSQFELFDAKLKTFNAGPTKAVKTRIDGVYFNSTLQRINELSDNMVVLRMTSPERDHSRGQYYLQSGGNRPLSSLKHPGLCSIVGHYSKCDPELPSSVAVASSQGSGYLGIDNAPFTIENLDKTRSLMENAMNFSAKAKELSTLQKKFNDFSPLSDYEAVKSQNRLNAKALKLCSNESFVKAIGAQRRTASSNYCPNMERQSVSSASEEEFSYNLDNSDTFLAQCNIASELLKIGIPSVQLELSGWDSHKDNFSQHMSLTSTLDEGVNELVNELKESGLFSDTIIYIAGEFGRSPKINKNEGREDFSRIFSSAVISGSIVKGAVFGETCKDGVQIKDAVSVAQASFGLLNSLGINPLEKANKISPLIPLKRKGIKFI